MMNNDKYPIFPSIGQAPSVYPGIQHAGCSFPMMFAIRLLATLLVLAIPFVVGCDKSSYGQSGVISSASSAAVQYTEKPAWHLSRISAQDAWEITSGNENTVIAVLDTGIDDTHPALIGKVAAAVNFTSSPVVTDRHGHGTHVAGTIAGGINEFGIATGIAYGCTLLNVKVVNDDGTVDAEAVAGGVRWAVDNGAHIINMSLVLYENSNVLEQAIEYAWQRGVLLIAAAGNRYNEGLAYPAMYPATIAVAATDKDNMVPRWSNEGDWIDVNAPGYAIFSSVPENGWAFKNGTSMAAALVSGEAALLFSRAMDVNLNGRINDEVRRAIQDSCDIFSINGDNNRVVNIYRALEVLGSLQAPDPMQ